MYGTYYSNNPNCAVSNPSDLGSDCCDRLHFKEVVQNAETLSLEIRHGWGFDPQVFEVFSEGVSVTESVIREVIDKNTVRVRVHAPLSFRVVLFGYDPLSA